MNTEALAQLSNVAVASATVVLALACLAHIAEWAAAREVRPVREAVPVGGAARAAARHRCRRGRR